MMYVVQEETPGIQEYSTSAPKITCTRFGMPEPRNFNLIHVSYFFLVFPDTFEKTLPGMARRFWGHINSIYVSAGDGQEQE